MSKQKNINVSEFVLEKLHEIKKTDQHKTLDSVLRSLILECEKK